jgi:hypothetical protein
VGFGRRPFQYGTFVNLATTCPQVELRRTNGVGSNQKSIKPIVATFDANDVLELSALSEQINRIIAAA